MLEDIIYNNRDALLEIASKYEEDIERANNRLIREYLENLATAAWTTVDTELPCKGDVVGLKYKSGFFSPDEVATKETYALNGERTYFLAWKYAKNSEVLAWTNLPDIFDNIPNPVALLVEEYDKRQNSQIKPESAKPFTHIWDDVEEGGDSEIDSPRSVIEAIEDAQKEMDYSNYHNSKFDTAIRVIKKYCADNKIPPNYRKRNDR